MSFLLDTMVISELGKRSPDRQVVAWLDRTADETLYLSVITIGEIERGIVKARAKGRTDAERLALWQEELASSFGARILAVDAMVARHWGRLTHEIGSSSADLMIAATALRHGLTVVTRNTSHFKRTGVDLLDPWQISSADS